MCSQCGWDYEADDTEEETDMPQNDRSTINIPKLRNIYQSEHKLPLPSDAEMERRAKLYDALWEKRNAKNIKRGWRQAHPGPFLFTPALGLFLFLLAIFGAGWLIFR